MAASSRALARRSVEVVEHRQRGLVLGVEPLLARVETGDPGLEGGEVVLGTVGPGDGGCA